MRIATVGALATSLIFAGCSADLDGLSACLRAPPPIRIAPIEVDGVPPYSGDFTRTITARTPKVAAEFPSLKPNPACESLGDASELCSSYLHRASSRIAAEVDAPSESVLRYLIDASGYLHLLGSDGDDARSAERCEAAARRVRWVAPPFEQIDGIVCQEIVDSTACQGAV